MVALKSVKGNNIRNKCLYPSIWIRQANLLKMITIIILRIHKSNQNKPFLGWMRINNLRLFRKSLMCYNGLKSR